MPPVLLFHKVPLAIQGLFFLALYEFKVAFSISVQNAIEILIGVALGHVVILIILLLLVHEHEMPLHISVSLFPSPMLYSFQFTHI